MNHLALTLLAGLLSSCTTAHKNAPQLKTIGQIVSWDESLSEIISTETPIEVLADGFQWSEGPAWNPKRQQLYFSDVPQNKAYKWSEKTGLEIFLDPSGIADENADGFREPGSNGLLMLPNNRLLLANHGKRALELIDIESKVRETLVNSFQGRTLNSPNDIVRANDGTLYFTDPPYGLDGLNSSPLKELDFSGIYKLSPDGDLSLIDKTQTFPNGIALSPDETKLYVAISDSDAPKILRYTKTDAGTFSDAELWFNPVSYMAQGFPGLPDGMVVADSGHVFATGPGGVFIISPDGKALGHIQTGRATANCTFGDDGRSLYITAGDTLARVRLVQGTRF